MSNSLSMGIFDTKDQLSKIHSRFILSKFTFLRKYFIKISMWCVFHYYVELIFIFNKIKHLDNVIIGQIFEYLKLFNASSKFIIIRKLRFRNCLNSIILMLN